MMFEPSRNVGKVARVPKVESRKAIVPQKAANQMANVASAPKENLVVKVTADRKRDHRVMANVVVTETADQKMDRHVTASVVRKVTDAVSLKGHCSSKYSTEIMMA